VKDSFSTTRLTQYISILQTDWLL